MSISKRSLYQDRLGTNIGKLRKNLEKRRFLQDASRIVYAGHSMGGHGAWVLATTDPDRALGVVVGAGWTSKETYGSSNTLFDHDISSTYTEPALMGLLRSTVYESDVDRYASNLAGLPVLVRVGAVDGTVPPYWSRKMARLLREIDGVDVKYSELPGKEHWWW
jgi:pimeloyl-ACP methyl ester carboxylesterase